MSEVAEFGSLAGGRVEQGSVAFGDVGGATEAVAELAEVRDYLAQPDRYRALGAAPGELHDPPVDPRGEARPACPRLRSSLH